MGKVDLAALGEKKFEQPSKFLKLKVGTNTFRILSEPYQYYVVGKKTARGFVRAIVEEGKDLPPFLQDVEPKLTFGFVVFSHDTGHFHVLETSQTLGVQLIQLMQERYPEEFKTMDIVVTARGEKLERKYTAIWSPKDNITLPPGANSNNAEYRLSLSHLERIK